MDLKSRIKSYSSPQTPEPKKQEIVSTQSQDHTPSPVSGKKAPLQFDVLNKKEMEYKETIHDKLLDILDLSLIVKMGEAEAKSQISEIARRLIDDENLPINSKSRQMIVNEVINDILGLGPLEHLLYEPSIADILVNGANRV